MQECVEVSGIYHGHSLFLCPHSLIHQIAGYLKGSLGSSLTVSALEHIELPVLNRKLHILHIPVMLLQSLANLCKLLEGLGELLLHLAYGHGSTYTGNHVLALGVL